VGEYLHRGFESLLLRFPSGGEARQAVGHAEPAPLR